ncbi:hypothetical protein JCM9279_002005 [Rhodotorula babjevae]
MLSPPLAALAQRHLSFSKPAGHAPSAARAHTQPPGGVSVQGQRPRLALSTRHAPPDFADDDVFGSSARPLSPSTRRRSYGSVIHFERSPSIRLGSSWRPATSSSRRTPSSRPAAGLSRSSERGGVAEASAATSVKVNFRLIFLALMLLATVTSLDNTTVYQYVSYATSSFEEHSTLGIIQTAQAIIIAVSRPLVSKESLLIGLSVDDADLLPAPADAVVAASPSIAVYAVGTLAAQLGNSALVSLQSTAIFTYSASLGNNALLNSVLSVPYYITGWIASFIVEGILKKTTWRWGYGILRRRVRALVSQQTHIGQLDALGLVLLAVALAGLLLPFTIVNQGSTTFSSPLFYAPVSAGAVSLALLVINEQHAACPLFPMRVFRTRRTIVCLSATALNMTSFFLLLTFQYSFSEQFTLMLAHLAVSFPVRRLVARHTELQRRGELFEQAGKVVLRAPMVPGHGVRVLGVGLMILSRGTSGPVWLLVVSQVIHDSTMIWALILLVGDVGNAAGTTLATLLWQDLLPRRLATRLVSTLTPADVKAIFESAEKAADYPLGSAASDGIRAAYADVMRILLYVALGLAGLSFALSLAMGPACVAERDAAAAATSPVEARGHELEARSVERVLGRRPRSRWTDEAEGGGEEEKRYLRWAREPAHEATSESDDELRRTDGT